MADSSRASCSFVAQKNTENMSENSESDVYDSDQDPEYNPTGEKHKFKVSYGKYFIFLKVKLNVPCSM